MPNRYTRSVILFLFLVVFISVFVSAESVCELTANSQSTNCPWWTCGALTNSFGNHDAGNYKLVWVSGAWTVNWISDNVGWGAPGLAYTYSGNDLAFVSWPESENISKSKIEAENYFKNSQVSFNHEDGEIKIGMLDSYFNDNAGSITFRLVGKDCCINDSDCASDEKCEAGKCVKKCIPSPDFNSDPNNCGGCGIVCNLYLNLICRAAVCALPPIETDLVLKNIKITQAVGNPDSNSNGKIDLIEGKPVMTIVEVELIGAPSVGPVDAKLEIYEEGYDKPIWISSMTKETLLKRPPEKDIKAGSNTFNFFVSAGEIGWKPERGKKYLFKAKVNVNTNIPEKDMKNNEMSISAETGSNVKTVFIMGQAVNLRGKVIYEVKRDVVSDLFKKNFDFLMQTYPLNLGSVSVTHPEEMRTPTNIGYGNNIATEDGKIKIREMIIKTLKHQLYEPEKAKLKAKNYDFIIFGVVSSNALDYSGIYSYSEPDNNLTIILIADINDKGNVLAYKYAEFLGLKPEPDNKTYPNGRLADNGWCLFQKGTDYGRDCDAKINVFSEPDYLSEGTSFKNLKEFAMDFSVGEIVSIGPRYFDFKDNPFLIGEKNAWVSKLTYETLIKKLVTFAPPPVAPPKPKHPIVPPPKSPNRP